MIMEHQLKVQRLKYSNLSKTDLNDLYACLSEPRVTDPIYWLNKPFLKEDAEALLARAMSEQKAQTDYWLAARNISDDQYVGNINIHRRNNDEAEIGYWIALSSWNKGYATEMVKYAIRFANTLDGTQVIIATTAEDNISSQAVLKKNGFKFDRIICSSSANNENRPVSYTHLTLPTILLV